MTKNLLTRTAGLELIASDGNVVISGNVRSARAVEAIAEVAGTVSGVKTSRSKVGMAADWHW